MQRLSLSSLWVPPSLDQSLDIRVDTGISP